MKTYYVITDTKITEDHTMYLYNGRTHADLTSHLDIAMTFETEDDAEEYIEEWEIEEWAGVEEVQHIFLLEKTSFSKKFACRGHWKVTANDGDHSDTITINDSMLIDAVFNTDFDMEDTEGKFYETEQEAKEAMLDKFNQ